MEENKSLSQINRLLLDQGFTRMEDIEKAEQIREENLKRANLPLGMILHKEGLISKTDLNLLMSHPQTKEYICRELKDRGWVPKEALETFFKGSAELKRLLKDDILTQERFAKIIHDTMDRVVFLKLALKKKMITGKTLEKVLLMKRYNKSVSEILLDENLVSLSELNYVYRKCDENLRLGTILVMQDIVTDEQIKEALVEHKEKGVSLGHVLLKNKLISLAQLYFALSIQFNTPFRELKGFMFNGKQEVELRDIVGQTYARENMIIPLFINASNLTLAVSNPSHIVKMHEMMASYSHLNMNCVLITEEKFDELYAMLYGEMLKPTSEKPEKSQESLFRPDGKWVMTEPSSQGWLISSLFDRYRSLCKGNGQEATSETKDLFIKFIQNSFDIICKDYNCKAVSFWFETGDNRPSLKASPVLMESGENQP